MRLHEVPLTVRLKVSGLCQHGGNGFGVSTKAKFITEGIPRDHEFKHPILVAPEAHAVMHDLRAFIPLPFLKAGCAVRGDKCPDSADGLPRLQCTDTATERQPVMEACLG